MAATKKIQRGAALVKKAIESSATQLTSPEAVPPGILKKLRLPDDEKLPAGLKTFLAHDATSLGWEFDDEEPEFEPMSLDELVAEAFGEAAVPSFGEAVEMFDGDCVLIEGEGETRSFLYVGTPDESGEYPVITLSQEGGTAKVAGIAPFDVWIAQRYGALPTNLPEEYKPVVQAMAEANGDGRVTFESQHRDISVDSDDDDDSEESDEESDKASKD